MSMPPYISATAWLPPGRGRRGITSRCAQTRMVAHPHPHAAGALRHESRVVICLAPPTQKTTTERRHRGPRRPRPPPRFRQARQPSQEIALNLKVLTTSPQPCSMRAVAAVLDWDTAVGCAARWWNLRLPSIMRCMFRRGFEL